MSTAPLKNLVKTLRATLTKLENASPPHEDGPATAELKAVLRLRIANLESALRSADELISTNEQ